MGLPIDIFQRFGSDLLPGFRRPPGKKPDDIIFRKIAYWGTGIREKSAKFCMA
jgi:hypothetical protein